MALYYAYGPYRIRNIRPKSDYSRGDVLQYDSASSLSYADPLLGTSEYAGIALSSSTESYDSKCPVLLIQPGTGFWTTIATGSAVSEGFPYDLVPVSGDWEIATSSTTPRVVVSKDQTASDISQRNNESNDSWVVVEFYTSADSGTVRVGTVFGG